ncbi:MAG: DUF480 domain-containing protein, partial [Gammaproteobacteria bacterium]|nr:DUF480 domain-containing protein [Gammaproteobacteria bacterium]
AIVCVLLLRGPQTPGELRTHCARLHDFSDNHVVTEALTGLIEREGGQWHSFKEKNTCSKLSYAKA